MSYQGIAVGRCIASSSGDHAFEVTTIEVEGHGPMAMLKCSRCGMNHEETVARR